MVCLKYVTVVVALTTDNSRHNMCNDEKLEYIRAVKCIHESPPKGNPYFGAITTRFEDFASAHINASTAPSNDPASKYAGPADTA
jgi:hypothetical protein